MKNTTEERKIGDYIVTNKNVKIGSSEFRAIMVSNHSTLDGLISETRDVNYDPGWSNITNYYTTIYILKKGFKDWELFYTGKPHDCPVSHDGYINTLKDFENEEVKFKDEIMFCKKEIKEYKEKIKEMEDYIKSKNRKIKELQK